MRLETGVDGHTRQVVVAAAAVGSIAAAAAASSEAGRGLAAAGVEQDASGAVASAGGPAWWMRWREGKEETECVCVSDCLTRYCWLSTCRYCVWFELLALRERGCSAVQQCFALKREGGREGGRARRGCRGVQSSSDACRCRCNLLQRRRRA